MPARNPSTPFVDMHTLVRMEINDPIVNLAGIAITNPRYPASQITAALKHSQMFLQREMRIVAPQDSRAYVDGTYTAQAVSMVLPTGVGYFDPIEKIENIDDPDRPVLIPSVGIEEIERYALSHGTLVHIPRGFPYRCALMDSGTDRHVMLRPRPEGNVAIRVWRLAPPMIFGAEDNAMAAHWEDLLVLQSAQELLSRREGMSLDQTSRLAMILQQFRAAANRRRQSQRIGRTRIGQS